MKSNEFIKLFQIYLEKILDTHLKYKRVKTNSNKRRVIFWKEIVALKVKIFNGEDNEYLKKKQNENIIRKKI